MSGGVVDGEAQSERFSNIDLAIGIAVTYVAVIQCISLQSLIQKLLQKIEAHTKER